MQLNSNHTLFDTDTVVLITALRGRRELIRSNVLGIVGSTGKYILHSRSMSLLELWDDDMLSLLPKSKASGVLYRVSQPDDRLAPNRDVSCKPKGPLRSDEPTVRIDVIRALLLICAS
jgi:hypothetical protein